MVRRYEPARQGGVPGLSLRQGRLHYRAETVFEGLEIGIPAGQWTCLLGPSGVGKSSLLRLLAGLHEAAEGEVTCSDGLPVQGRISYMAQKDLLLPWLTVQENVALGDRLRGQPRSRAARETASARALDLLAQTGLEGWASARPDALSGGMRQRVALARTLYEDRPIVLLDEPFSALDVLTRIALQDLFAHSLAGKTVLLVTHDPLEALRLGDRVLVLSGRPARPGDPVIPPGIAPRPTDAAEILALQGQLLLQLAGNGDRQEGTKS